MISSKKFATAGWSRSSLPSTYSGASRTSTVGTSNWLDSSPLKNTAVPVITQSAEASSDWTVRTMSVAYAS